MKNARGGVLYVGKAGNLRRRVSSYFTRALDARLQKLVSEIHDIETRKTDTAIEALILESELIKKLQPPFNVLEKDDKSFLYVEITKDKFPRVLLARGKDESGKNAKRYGPFTSASSIREAMRILRKIFHWSIHTPEKLQSSSYKLKTTRPCFEYEIGLCPGTCVGAISSADYKKTISGLKLFFDGKKERLIKNLKKEMVLAGKKLEFERAEKIKRQIFALQHVQDVALIKDDPLFVSKPYTQNPIFRIEGYDISSISGDSAVGSMVVFTGGKPDKNEYRKFKIKNFSSRGDTGMMKEVLERRFKNNWPLPSMILVDGGAGQVGAAKQALCEVGLKIPVIGIAKGPKRKRNDFIGFIPKWVEPKTLISVRDEAHRFAISYHKKLRGKKFLDVI